MPDLRTCSGASRGGQWRAAGNHLSPTRRQSLRCTSITPSTWLSQSVAAQLTSTLQSTNARSSGSSGFCKSAFLASRFLLTPAANEAQCPRLPAERDPQPGVVDAEQVRSRLLQITVELHVAAPLLISRTDRARVQGHCGEGAACSEHYASFRCWAWGGSSCGMVAMPADVPLLGQLDCIWPSMG